MALDYSNKPAILNGDGEPNNGQYHLYIELSEQDMSEWFNFLHGAEPIVKSEVEESQTDPVRITDIDDEIEKVEVETNDAVTQTVTVVVPAPPIAPKNSVDKKKKKKKKKCTIM